jgi:hypothetical protein
MRVFFAHDVRVEGRTPSRGTDQWAIQVGAKTPMSSFIVQAEGDSSKYNGDIQIKIIAHGDGVEGKPGGILQFCEENLKVTTVELLRPLSGKVKGGVELLACRAALISPGCEGKDGDGNVLCSRMAQILETTVKASTARQAYIDRGEFELKFCRWEGTVLTYGPKGDVIKVEYNPVFENSTDPFGPRRPSCVEPKEA